MKRFITAFAIAVLCFLPNIINAKADKVIKILAIGNSFYNNDQMVMYDSIISAVRKISKETGIKVIIPSGTAVQNARQTILKDTITRDGYHLHKVYGRYIAACTWFETTFKKNVVGNSYKPSEMSSEQCLLAQKSAHMAVKKPYKTSKIK